MDLIEKLERARNDMERAGCFDAAIVAVDRAIAQLRKGEALASVIEKHNAGNLSWDAVLDALGEYRFPGMAAVAQELGESLRREDPNA